MFQLPTVGHYQTAVIYKETSIISYVSIWSTYFIQLSIVKQSVDI